MIRNRSVAMSLMISYSKQQDLKLLKDLYHQLEQPREIANISVMEGYQSQDIDRRLTQLQEALVLYTESKDLFAAKSTEEQIKLLLLQRDLEATLDDGKGVKFVDCSVNDTLSKLIVLGQSKRASKIKSDFKVPDKRFWWIKIKALVSVKDWMSLEKFAKEKKSPIGYVPFVDECIRAGALAEAEKYITKIQEAPIRAAKYMEIGLFVEAAEVARLSKDLSLLTLIKSRCTNAKSLAIIEQIAANWK